MKIKIISLCFLLGFISPVVAETKNADHRYIIDVVQSLKNIIHKQKDEKVTQTVLNNIKGSKPLIENGHYKGQQIIQSGKLSGFIGVEFNNKKANIAVYSTIPLKVRYSTRLYQAFRIQLQKHYKELRHNQFDLGDQVVARIKKQSRKITIDVYRNK